MSLWSDYKYDYYADNEVEEDKFDKRVTCKYCNASNLTWKKENNKWKLYTKKGERHNCKR